LESYVVRRYACHISLGEQNNHAVFRRLAHAMYDKQLARISLCTEYMLTTLLSIPKHSQERWPNDAEFEQAFLEREQFRRGQRATFAQYLLDCIERGSRRGDELDYKEQEYAVVEHVMPEKLTGQWKRDLVGQEDSVHRKYLNTMGNLVLVPKGIQTGDSYRKKSAIYETLSFRTTQDVADLEKWNGYSIRNHAAKLFGVAVNTWRYPELAVPLPNVTGDCSWGENGEVRDEDKS